MKYINSPCSSRAIFLLVSQNVCNGSNACCSLWAAGHCGCGAACTALLCRWQLVLPYRDVLSLNCSWFQLSQAGWESPSSHQGTLNTHGSTEARGGSSQGRAAVGSSLAKARSHNTYFLSCVQLLVSHCRHCIVSMQSHQCRAGTAPRRTLGSCADLHMTLPWCVKSHSVHPAHPGADRDSEMLRTSVLTLAWGSNSSAPDAARDEKQPFPLPNFLILALHLEALHCWLPW